MQNNMIETLMGAVVLVVAGFFLVFAYTSSGYKTSRGVFYVARFDRVDGINVGSEVRVSGVKVGRVNEVSIDPRTFLAELRLSVNSDLNLPRDTSAEIISAGLLGDKSVSLVPGGDEDVLRPGEEITHTQSSVSLEAMIGQLIFSKNNEGDKEKSNPDFSTETISSASRFSPPLPQKKEQTSPSSSQTDQGKVLGKSPGAP